MKTTTAIEILTSLKAEAESSDLRPPGDLTAWKGKVRGVLVEALGPGDDLIIRLDEIHYTLTAYSSSTPQSSFDRAREAGIAKACGVVEAAVFQLRLREEDDREPTDQRSFDPELWEHVKDLITSEDWSKIPSQTAIFVENHVRLWAGDPKDKNGDSLYGKALWAKVLEDSSELRLGARASEWEGWRFLGMGFAQAVSNVDRHRIQKRDDARRYASGVLGLGSLLLTQLRFEHSEVIGDEGRSDP